MRRNLLLKALTGLMVTVCFIIAVPAQGTGGGLDVKIAFVNSLEILQGCDEGKAEIAKIDVFAKSKEQELKTVSDELNTLRTNFQSEASSLNPATAAEMQAAIQTKDKQLRRITEDAEAELEAKRAELFSKMGEKIRTVISEHAVANDLGIVFLESPGLPYHSDTLNITEDIIKAYNAKYPSN